LGAIDLLASVSDANTPPNIGAGAAGGVGASATSGGGGGGPSGSDIGAGMAQDAAIGATLGGAKTAPGVSPGVGTVLTVITAAGVGAEGIIHIKKSRGVFGRNSESVQHAMDVAGVTW